MDIYTRRWIITNSKEVLATYSEGITLRQLYYRLVSKGMTNDIQHYKRVIAAMTDARWDGIVDMEAFVDRERSMYGRTRADEMVLDDEIENAKRAIKMYMTAHHLNMWSNQETYVEVWIEKKALQGVFEGPCNDMSVGLAPCKGYPSLTFLNEAKGRFESMVEADKPIVILYFGDYDPSGEDIPRSIKDNLARMGAEVEVERIALNPDLIKKLRLPGVPPKKTDSRTANWDGHSAVELDAVEPEKLKEMCEEAINRRFNPDLHYELKEKEAEERKIYQQKLKEYVNTLHTGDDADDSDGEGE